MDVANLLTKVGGIINDDKNRQVKIADQSRLLLSEVKGILRVHTYLQKTRSEIYGQLAPNFNVLDFLKTTENGLSSIIGFLLDAKGTHAQGGLFLENFMKQEFLAENPKFGGDISVTTNFPTEEGRYIDIVLHDNNFYLGIENKKWAKDQENQLIDYSNDLNERSNGNYLLIYLTPDGHKPSDLSIAADEFDKLSGKNQLKLVSYGQIIEWLKQANPLCQSERVRHFVNDFIAYINSEILGESIMDEVNNTIVDTILESPQSLEAAFKIKENIIHVEHELIVNLNKQLYTLALEWKALFSPDESFGNSYKELYYSFVEKPLFRISFGFEYSGYKNFYYGIIFAKKEAAIQLNTKKLFRLSTNDLQILIGYVHLI